MPLYQFECHECGCIEEFRNSISEGPPKRVVCPICEQDGINISMHHVFGGAFILKGDGWPGKSLKSSEYAVGKAKEETDHKLQEDARNQRVVEEVMAVRRKGRAATDRLKQDNPQKFKDYQSAVKSGYRAKGKSYKAKLDGC